MQSLPEEIKDRMNIGVDEYSKEHSENIDMDMHIGAISDKDQSMESIKYLYRQYCVTIYQ